MTSEGPISRFGVTIERGRAVEWLRWLLACSQHGRALYGRVARVSSNITKRKGGTGNSSASLACGFGWAGLPVGLPCLQCRDRRRERVEARSASLPLGHGSTTARSAGLSPYHAATLAPTRALVVPAICPSLCRCSRTARAVPWRGRRRPRSRASGPCGGRSPCLPCPYRPRCTRGRPW